MWRTPPMTARERLMHAGLLLIMLVKCVADRLHVRMAWRCSPNAEHPLNCRHRTEAQYQAGASTTGLKRRQSEPCPTPTIVFIIMAPTMLQTSPPQVLQTTTALGKRTRICFLGFMPRRANYCCFPSNAQEDTSKKRARLSDSVVCCEDRRTADPFGGQSPPLQ